MRKRVLTGVNVVAVPWLAVVLFAACSGSSGGSGGNGWGGSDGGGGVEGGSGGSGGGSGNGSGGSTSSGGADASASSSGSSGSGSSSGGSSSSSGSTRSSGSTSSSGAGSSSGCNGCDASQAYDAVGSADVLWGQPCLYNFGSSCPFQNPQECGNHQAIDVTFPNGPQLLNATLFAGTDCSPSAQQDNFNDQQNTRGTALWMFTDDAAIAGVSPSNPTSAIWWVGPLTSSGYPPANAPTTGCINYTSAMAMCQ